MKKKNKNLRISEFKLLSVLGIGLSGLNNDPNIIHENTIHAMINIAPRQEVFEISVSVNGAKMKVPNPAPHTAMPVANERYFSKYIVTLTIAGR